VSGVVGERTKIKCKRDHRHGPKAKKAARGRGADYHPSPSHRGRHSDPPGHDGTPPGSSEDPGQGAKHKAPRCTTADLVVGAVVEEAELKLKNGGAFYKKVVLAGKTQTV
jgi:hypothetical protein